MAPRLKGDRRHGLTGVRGGVYEVRGRRRVPVKHGVPQQRQQRRAREQRVLGHNARPEVLRVYRCIQVGARRGVWGAKPRAPGVDAGRVHPGGRAVQFHDSGHRRGHVDDLPERAARRSNVIQPRCTQSRCTRGCLVLHDSLPSVRGAHSAHAPVRADGGHGHPRGLLQGVQQGDHVARAQEDAGARDAHMPRPALGGCHHMHLRPMCAPGPCKVRRSEAEEAEDAGQGVDRGMWHLAPRLPRGRVARPQ